MATDDLRIPTVRSSGTYRMSVYEDGKEVGFHEADLTLPEDIVANFS